MVSKKIEKLVQKFLDSPAYLRNGAGQLSKRWKVSKLDIYEARDEARRRLRGNQNKTIKRLFFDIETAPNIGYFWRAGYKLNVHYSNIIQERAIMCISYKWAGEEKVHNIFWDGYYDDKNILEEFIPVIKEADEVVGHNSDRFDIKWVNTRAAYHGLNLPSKFRSFDTLKKVKAQFTLNSNTLKYCAEFFGLTGKIDTGGFDLWTDILGDIPGKSEKAKTAKNKMIEYCNGDVVTLEDLYNYVEKYTKPVTNHAILQGGKKYHCPACASINTSLSKTSTPVSGTIKRHMECDVCNVNFDISNKTYMLYLDDKMKIMITLNKLIYDLWEIVRPNLSDDDNFDKRQLAFWIQTQRALLVRNELNKNRTIDDNLIQDLGCLELELADKADCCEISDGCKILRTKDIIPNTIELHNKTAITRVAPIDKHTIPFSHVSYERAIWSGNGRFNKNQIFTFLLNDRIYLMSKSDSLLKYATHINVRGVFEDPTEVGKFTQCENNTVCYTNDMKYPINAWMVDYMKAAILQLNFQTALQAPQDNTNNAKADNNESA